MSENPVFKKEDYVQSSNALFHFMKKKEFLVNILEARAIKPRYCIEDVKYLKIHNDGIAFDKIAVLQKCFCDIPFHKLTEKCNIRGTGSVFDKLTENEKFKITHNSSHPEFYGKFAIAFSKNWGEKNNLQPVQYLNTESEYTFQFSKLIDTNIMKENVEDEFVDDILNRLAFIKPLRGKMERKIEKENAETVTVEIYKNFHDEKEWRYSPSATALDEYDLKGIIPNPNIVEAYNILNVLNLNLEYEIYRKLWIDYNYDDVRYIIVPDSIDRQDIIKTIMGIDEKNFNNVSVVSIQKSILISKILVLDEIGKDW